MLPGTDNGRLTVVRFGKTVCTDCPCAGAAGEVAAAWVLCAAAERASLGPTTNPMMLSRTMSAMMIHRM
ncbi:MAG TPA: hypothetical protein VGQ93_08180 [Lysobacter sp.]|nr:hypothetical protein [Lysobacter sp.]